MAVAHLSEVDFILVRLWRRLYLSWVGGGGYLVDYCELHPDSVNISSSPIFHIGWIFINLCFLSYSFSIIVSKPITFSEFYHGVIFIRDDI